jgi:hypothetical protein
MSSRGQTIANDAAMQQHLSGQGAADLLSVAEAAAVLNVSPRQVRRLAESEQLGDRIGTSGALNRARVLALKTRREGTR